MNKRLLDNITNESIVRSFEKNKYPIDKTGRINIANIRSSDRTVGIFNDACVLFYYIDGKIVNIKKYSVTVDPGLSSLLKPVNPLGCAIVAPGFYPNVLKLGLHKGKYPALVQCGDIVVFRDNNMNNKYDILKKSEIADVIYYTRKTGIEVRFRAVGDLEFKYSGQKGMFGINNHMASKFKILTEVGLYSAGCTVHEDPNLFQNDFIPFIKKMSERSNLQQSTFSAAWIDSDDLI